MEEEAAEEAVVRSPWDVTVWLDYLRVRQDAPFTIRLAVYERALYHVPGSYKLWFSYLKERYLESRGRSDFDEVVLGTFRAYERCVIYLSRMPRIWLEFAKFCEEMGRLTQCRLVLDRALKALPVTQHDRIWRVYLALADKYKDNVRQLGTHAYTRYLQFDPLERERFVDFLMDTRQFGLAMSELNILLKDKKYTSTKGRSKHELWMMMCEMVTKYPEDAKALGKSKVDVEATLREGISRFTDETGRLWCSLAEYYIRLGLFDRAQDVYEEGMRSVATVRDFSTIFDAYTQFHEGILNAKIDIFGDDDEELEGVESKEEAKEVKANKSFYDVNVDAEDKINDVDLRLAQMESLMEERPFLLNSVILKQNPHNCEEWHKRAKLFESKGDLASVVLTYKQALDKVNPAHAIGHPYTLWVALARVYEENDDLDEAREVFNTAIESPFKDVEDLVNVYCCYVEMELRSEEYDRALDLLRAALTPVSERKVLEKLIQVRQEKAKGVWKKNPKKRSEEDGDKNKILEQGQVDGEVETVAKEKTKLQRKLFRSTKLWSLYVDLEESLGTLRTTSAAYEKMIDLKIATPQTILNYAGMLEENRYFEESFRAYEKGVALFDWPHVNEIWLNYLDKFIHRYGGDKLFRTRELFEQALKTVPQDFCKPIYLLLEAFEEKHGDPRRALNALDRLCEAAPPDERVDLFLVYIGKAEEFFGISRAREVYEKAIEKLQDPIHIRTVCLRYAEKERKLGEVDRARAILRYGSQFADPRTVLSYWRTWNDFEVAHGNEDTFREMLRVKRTVAVQYKQTNFNLDSAINTSEPLSAPVLLGPTASQDLSNKRGMEPESQGDQKRQRIRDGEESETVHVSSSKEEEGEAEDHDDEEQAGGKKELEEEVQFSIQQQQVPSSVFGDAILKAGSRRK